MSNASKAAKTRTITLEEHFMTSNFLEGPGQVLKGNPHADQLIEQVCSLGERRIADMDAAGIDIQVLSLAAPGVEQLDPPEAIELARETNNELAEAVKLNPDRLAGFAAIPTPSPDAAADELERMVSEHGFKGAVINGHSRGRYLDDDFFWPILERAEALQVPIYLHPTIPPQPVVEASFTGNFSAQVSNRLSGPGWGWHIETAVHIIRLILSGAFDRYPRLQFIIGHLGEALPFMLPRMNRALPMEMTRLPRPMGDYLRENIHYTISGFFFIPTFLDLLFEVGIDRIMFSTDYPHGSMKEGCAFLDQLSISPADRERIAHGNAESLLGL